MKISEYVPKILVMEYGFSGIIGVEDELFFGNEPRYKLLELLIDAKNEERMRKVWSSMAKRIVKEKTWREFIDICLKYSKLDYKCRKTQSEKKHEKFLLTQ